MEGLQSWGREREHCELLSSQELYSTFKLQPVTVHLQRLRGIGDGALLRAFFCGDPKATKNGDFVVRLGVDWEARDKVGGVVG